MYNTNKVLLAAVLITVALALQACAPQQPVYDVPAPAPSPNDIVGFVDPCGTAPGIYNEVFFRLASGQLVASYTQGANTRLVIVPPGDYITTDGDNCYFTVDASYNILNEHH